MNFTSLKLSCALVHPRKQFARQSLAFLATTPHVSPNALGSPPSQAIKTRLRKYQEECIQSVLSNLEKGRRRLGISLATGSGKTVIFTHLIEQVPHTVQNASQTLILVHRRELVEQAASHCSRVYPDKTIEIEMGNLHASGFADITIASIQSINSGDRLAKFDRTRFKLVLIDECHHAVTPGYMRTLDHFGLLKPSSNSPALVGVSATLSRFDGVKLGVVIDHIVYHKDYVDMISEKWLADVLFTTVQSKADISAVKNGVNGDFNPSDLSRAINTDQTNDLTVRAWISRAGERKSTIVFCVDLAHVTGLTNAFRNHGFDARFVTGDTPKAERSQRLDAFKRREYPVIINCGVFTEGTDIPNIDCVLLARPTKSRNLLVQMIGRGMRLYPGKKDCHIIDMVASLETGIVTIPTLFGLDPSVLVDGAKVGDLKALERKKAEQERQQQVSSTSKNRVMNSKSISSTVTFTDYDSVFELIEDTSGERHIRALSPLAWVEVAKEKYVLSTQAGHYLTMEKKESLYIIRETRKISHITAKTKAPFMPPRELATTQTFADAVHAADTYAQEAYPWFSVSKDQAWRRRPASENQIAFLNKFRTKDDQLTEGDITKGKAGDMITKLKHGARGRFEKILAGKRKEEKARNEIQQMETMKHRERVTVGPLLT